MTLEQEQSLNEKLTRIGYPDYEVVLGQEGDVLLLHIDRHLICSVGYALSMSDEQLAMLISDTLTLMRGEQ